MSSGRKERTKLTLPPFKVSAICSLNEAKQKSGWGITAFNMPEAWMLTQGEGVKVAVLDTGCDLDHPDLVANLLPGKNFVTQGKPPEDDQVHGTHVTGIICAENNEIGMVGVAPRAQVIPVKVLDQDGAGDPDIVVAGIDWAVKSGADIICMSLGSPIPIPEIRKSIQNATTKGIPVFVAAGNAGNTKQCFYPANYPETIAIGSIDENFDRSSFSNTGDELDFMAPGNKIFSTVPDNWYAFLSGTSMAAPFAVGVTALVLSYVRKHQTNFALKTVEDFKNILRSRTIPINDPSYGGKKFFEGFGIIDPRKFSQWMDFHPVAEENL